MMVGEVGDEPVECCARNADLLQTVEEDGEINSVKGGKEVEEEDGHGIGYFEEGCFSTVGCAEPRLKYFQELCGVEILLELGDDEAFQNF